MRRSFLTGRLARPVGELRKVGANRNLRRLCLALAAFETSTPAFGVALLLFAFERGGAGAVGLVGLVTMVPAAAAAPFAALVADRAPRERVICYTLVQQGTSDEVRARVFGVLEGLAVGAVGLGCALGGVLVTNVGVRGALVVAASIPLLGALAAAGLSLGTHAPVPEPPTAIAAAEA